MSAISAGYKLTELGVIPIDWIVASLDDKTLKVGSGITPTGGNRVYRSAGRPFVRSQNVGWGKLKLDDIAFIDDLTHATFSATEIELDDVFLNITGASIGRSAVAHKLLVGGNVNQHVCIIRPNKLELLPRYLSIFLISTAGQSQIDAFQSGGNRQGLNFQQVRSICISMPASASEQSAIVAALGDIDALLDGIDRLITKKRDVKLAVMQQLLTGQTRLPGFSCEWNFQPLASVVADLEAGVSVNSVAGASSAESGEMGILKTSCIANGRFHPDEYKLIDPRELSRAKVSIKRDAIIISRMNTPNLVGEVGYVENDFPNLFLPDRLWITHFKTDVELCRRWLAYVLSSTSVKLAIQALATGTSGSMKNIAKRKLLELEINFPPVAEQTAIAAVLSDMDTELDALESRRDKTLALKQSMMQELLTGRIRLV